MHQFLKFIFAIKHYMIRTVPLSIIRSFSLYTQQWYTCMSYRYDIYHCCVYSEKLLMMDRGTVRNQQSFIPKIEKSVHLLGSIIKIYHAARSPERQILISVTNYTVIFSKN